MPNISDVTGSDLKKQQDEYYLLVTEVIGGMAAEITDHSNRLLKAEEQFLNFSEKLEELSAQNMLLTRELLVLKSGQK